MMGSRRIHFGAYQVHVAPLPAVAALLMLVLLLSAGFWQLRRAEGKREIALEQAARGDQETLVLEPGMVATASLPRLRLRRARAAGRYRSDIQYLLDNSIQNHAVGYQVLTPLRLRGGDVYLLVNRGWLPVGPDRGRLPDVAVRQQQANPEGLIVAPPASGLVLGPSGYEGEGWPRVVQRVELDRIQEQLGKPLLPFVLRLSPTAADGYGRDWQVRTGLTPERHLGYAVQWFALAAALLGLCAWVAVKRTPEEPHGS